MFDWSFFIKKNSVRPTVLVILDGFGLAPPSPGNAIYQAKMNNFISLLNDYPHTELIASGESVGLPANEVGNTEVGHLTIGAGRVILQDLKRINLAIERGSFYENKAFLLAANHVKSNNSNLHIFGLLGSGRVHSSKDHIYALLQFCKKEMLKNVCVHVFTDGRDSPPKEGVTLISELERYLNLLGVGFIASVSGRYYAMDRDRRWQRIEKVYKALTEGVGNVASSAKEAVEIAYQKGQTDEFIEPTLIVSSGRFPCVVKDNDAVIFANFRIDRAKQLTMAFVLPNFEDLKAFDFGYDPQTNLKLGQVQMGDTFVRAIKPKNLVFVTMTEYQENLPVSAVAFGPEQVEMPFAEVVSRAEFSQLRMSESEKERFVTYYFNGLRETAFDGEDKLIVPSPKVPTYDQKPEMSLYELVDKCKKQISKNKYNFILINFANPDMLGHTGNIKATIKALEAVDKNLKNLVAHVLKYDGLIAITADHGNCEEMLTYPTTTFFYTSQKGILNTDHSNNPVPFLLISQTLKGKSRILRSGSLSDVAPTLLNLMNLSVPPQMTGQSLLLEAIKT